MKYLRRVVTIVITAILVVSFGSVDRAFAIENEFFKQGQEILFSSKSASSVVAGDFIYYSQLDPAWKNDFYSEKLGATIGVAGCGPTSLAMIIATLVDSGVKPPDVAAVGNAAGSVVEGVGTDHLRLLNAAKAQWPFTYTDLTGASMETLVAVVQSGGYVYMGGDTVAPFTDLGHVVVIRGVDANGNLVIADPFRGEADVYTKEVVDSYRTSAFGITP